jgi:hypothetical protein
MPQIVDAIGAQARQGTDTPMDHIQPRWCPRPTTGATKQHWEDCRRPLEDGSIKTLVPEIQECCTEFLGHIDTPTAATLRGVKHVVDRIIGPLKMQKPVGIVGVMPELDVIPVQPGPGQTEE